MKRNVLLFFLSTILVFLPYSHLHAANRKATVIKGFLKKANAYYTNNRPFDAINTLTDAIKKDADHPLVRVQLSILYYGLGLLDEAIVEAEQAVKMDPGSEKNRFDLAKFYLIDKQYSKAERQFHIILTRNPGFTLGYFYLGLTYYRQGKDNLARLCVQRAKKLGHRGTVLEEKLGISSLNIKDRLPPTQKKDHLYRFIMVPSKEEAETILSNLRQGKLFDVLVIEKKNRKKQVDSGLIMLSEIKASIAKSVKNLKPFSEPVMIHTDPDYRIIQRIAPFDIRFWEKIAASGDIGGKKTRRAPSSFVTISKLEERKTMKPLLAKTQKQTMQPALSAPAAKLSPSIKSAKTVSKAGSRKTVPVQPSVASASPPEPVVDKKSVQLAKKEKELRQPPATAVEPAVVAEQTQKKASPAKKETRVEQEAKKVEKLKAFDTILKWRNAWQSRDVKGYLSMYSKHFKPAKKLSRKTWEKKRRGSLTRPKYIVVGIENLIVEMKSDSKAVATFIQDYTSDRYADTVNKKLVLVKEGGSWKISRETTD